MTVTFKNRTLRDICTALSRMDAGKTYSRGDGVFSGVGLARVANLVERGLAVRIGAGWQLTPFGASVAALIRSIGA